MTQPFIPALRYRSLTFLYDRVVRLTTRERRFKEALLHQADLQPRQQVLDLACGTATLTIAARQAQPQAEFICIDADADILERARRKAQRAGVSLRFDRAMSMKLPFPDARFDVVLSSLFFHHLDRQGKLASLKPQAGFAEVSEQRRFATPLGTISLYSARRSAMLPEPKR